MAASHEQRRRTRARPKTAGAVSSSSRERGGIEQDRCPDRQEWEVGSREKKVLCQEMEMLGGVPLLLLFILGLFMSGHR